MSCRYPEQMPNTDEPKKQLLWPTIWLALGLALGVSASITALLGLGAVTGLLAGLTAAVAIVLTYVIAYRQAKESSALSKTVMKIDTAVSNLTEANERLYQLTLSAAETDSAQAYETDEEETPDAPALDVGNGESESPDGQEPPYAAEALSRLRSAGSSITPTSASWKQKVPDPPIRGNHGWFVESNDPEETERWYVRKGRYWTIRKAMPREYLEALGTKRGVKPQTVKLDFQLKDHGLASWYARTYDGDLWQVSKPNRNKDLGIQVVRVDENLQLN